MRLFAEATGPAAARSSLEVMLDTIRKRDEQPKDLPPSLPARPTSRGRLPSSRRSLPVKLAVKSSGKEFSLLVSQRRGKVEEESDEKNGTMGGEGLLKMKCVQESPDHGMLDRMSYEERLETEGFMGSNCTTSSTVELYGQFKSVEAINYFFKKEKQILRMSLENTLPANPEIHDSVNDIAQLRYLNEPSVLHSLKYRFSRDMIYTKAGSVLLAFNPFKGLVSREKDSVAACWQKVGENAHVFAVADDVFNEMSTGGRNQSIVISGESGSGKSEIAKIAMQYLTTLAGDDRVGFKVLRANAILESFGNAKTLKNENSSRFGKVVELHFTDTKKMCSAKFEAFQLEKSRIGQRAVGERSYRVFHQLCAGAPPFLKGVINVANLLGYEVNELIAALSTQKSHLGNHSLVQKLTLSKAIDTRDALAESIYASLFDWIVVQINKSVQVAKSHSRISISIVDICGLEYSSKNGFEQFCTNYANERMQRYFFSHLLKREQAEYTLDGIEWSSIAFSDNFECLNIFEKSQGILHLLDEESASSEATDLTFANKLKHQLRVHPCFKGEGNFFRIRHYAREVLYSTIGFLKNNRIMLHEDSIKLLLSGRDQLPQLFASLSSFTSPMQSVGTILKVQLLKFVQRLENTNLHFIRCINPSCKQLPGIFEEDFVMRQLRCISLLEVAKMSRSGYLIRMTHEVFAERYQCLLMQATTQQDSHSAAVAIIQQFNVPADMYQVGYTKIFFRTGQIGILETARAQTLQRIVCVQKCLRGLRDRHSFNAIKNGVTTLQSFVRAEGARRELQYMVKRQRAVVLIQKHVEQWLAKKAFATQQQNIQQNIVLLQSAIRGWLAREQFSKRNMEMTKSNHVKLRSSIQQKFQELKDTEQEDPLDVSDMAELKNRVLKVEAELRHKKEENSSLRQLVQQYEIRWLDYDAKMKTMEETWQKQMTSLQMSLAAAKRSLATDDVSGIAGRLDASPNYHYFDSEDTMSIETHTTEGTPAKRSRASGVGIIRTPDVARNAVNHLVKEFEQRRRVFDDDAAFLVEVKSGQSISDINLEEEFKNLKAQFAVWKKDYKIRLRETKVALQKLGNAEVTKARRKWWGKRSRKWLCRSSF